MTSNTPMEDVIREKVGYFTLRCVFTPAALLFNVGEA